MSPLKSRTTYKDVVNSVSKFGGILFTFIRWTAVACYVAGPLKVRLSFRSQNIPPPPLNPLNKHRYKRRHLVTAHSSQLTIIWLWHCVLWISHHYHHHISVMELGHLLTRFGLIYPEVSSKVCHDSFCHLGNSVSLRWVLNIACSGIHCGLKYQHWPMKRKTLTWPERLSVAYCTHIIQTKLMLKKSEISTKIDVYSYKKAHRHASCSVAVICRGCGVVTCNIQSSV